MGSFARLAKATYLLCHVLRQGTGAGLDEPSGSETPKQLEGEIRALISLPDVEDQIKGVGGSPQTAFCYRSDFSIFQLNVASKS